MNNYLSLNLISGKLTRFSGGGYPRFILNEQNKVQFYFIDYADPDFYPSNALGDAFSDITTRNFNDKTLTISIGKRGQNKIVSTNSFFNLPNIYSITPTSNISLSNYESRTRVSFNGVIELPSIPEISSIFSITATVTGINRSTSNPFSISITSPFFSFNNSITEIKSIFDSTIDFVVSKGLDNCVGNFVGCSRVDINSFVYQNSDYSYSFEYIKETCSDTPTSSLAFSVSVNSSKASSNYGKYGVIDFSSPNWNSIIGTKNEAAVWMEAMVDGETIAQGNAIIYRKMT